MYLVAHPVRILTIGITATGILALQACAPRATGPDARVWPAPAAPEPDHGEHRVVPLRPMPSDVEILYGDPSRPGEPFVMRIRELPGTVIPPHSHPVDEHITVVSGTWYFALGESWDPARLQRMDAGTYAFAPAGSVMYAHSPEAAVVQVHGVGPFDIHWLHGTRTLDDADAARIFAYTRGRRVRTDRGLGVIRNGYASGDIVQYEIVADDGLLYMTLERSVTPE